jgi:hypothetical protein
MTAPFILKPAAGPFWIPDLRPQSQRLWIDCVLAMPFWSIGQNHVEDVGPFKFHGVLGSGISSANDWKGSPYGASLLWNGNTNDKVTVADPPSNVLDGFSSFSLEVIFKTTTIGADGVFYGLVGKHRPSSGVRAWRFYINGDELQLQTSNDGEGNEVQITTDANLAANAWYQAILTFASGVWSVRLNGRLLATDGNFGTHTTIFAGGEELKIGQRTTAGGGSDTTLNGEIASVRIWAARALSVEDTLLLSQDIWGMYDVGLGLPSLALEHSGGAAAGSWIFAGSVAKGIQNVVIPGLLNAVSYDVQGKTRDASGNVSAGNTPVAGTPVAAANVPIHLRRPVAAALAYPGEPWQSL